MASSSSKLRSFRLPAELDEFLRLFSKQLGISDSEVIVRCLAAVKSSGEINVEMPDIRVPGGYQLEVKEFPLPDSVEGIISLIRAALNRGGVQEFILRLGQPVRISRLITDESQPLELFVISDISADIRNLDTFIELETAETIPGMLVSKMLDAVRQRGMVPRAWACNSKLALLKWLGLPDLTEDVLGVTVHESSDIPVEALVLCASPEGMDRLTFGVKTTMEVSR